MIDKFLNATEGRGDLSRYMVHLTRDDRGEENGATARDNFLQMLAVGEITALRPHCMHRKKVPHVHRKKFRVCCFSETPLSEIKHLVGFKPGRRAQLEPYGFVFSRELVIESGAQPVTYVNSFGSDPDIRKGYDQLLAVCLKGGFTGSKWRPLAFVSAMHGGYDFSWEREWRHLGSFQFTPQDLVCAVVPDGDDVEIRSKLARLAIPMFSPDWGLEKMVEEFRRQQRRTMRLLQPTVKTRVKVRRRK